MKKKTTKTSPDFVETTISVKENDSSSPKNTSGLKVESGEDFKEIIESIYPKTSGGLKTMKIPEKSQKSSYKISKSKKKKRRRHLKLQAKKQCFGANFQGGSETH